MSKPSALERLAAIGGTDGSSTPLAVDLSQIRAPKTIVAIDQSFNATGIVWLTAAPGAVTITRATTVTADPCSDSSGTIQMLDRARDLADQLKTFALDMADAVVFEQPPLGGGLRGSEVPLLAGFSVMVALDPSTPVHMVHSDRWKRVIGGTGRGKKSTHATLPHIKGLSGLDWVTNESQRDALCIGLTWLITNTCNR